MKELLAFREQADLAVYGEGTVKADALYPLGRQAVKEAFGLYATMLPALDALLAERTARQERRLAALAALTVLGLLLSAYLFISFRKVLEGGLREVALHLNSMRDGDLTHATESLGCR